MHLRLIYFSIPQFGTIVKLLFLLGIDLEIYIDLFRFQCYNEYAKQTEYKKPGVYLMGILRPFWAILL